MTARPSLADAAGAARHARAITGGPGACQD